MLIHIYKNEQYTDNLYRLCWLMKDIKTDLCYEFFQKEICSLEDVEEIKIMKKYGLKENENAYEHILINDIIKEYNNSHIISSHGYKKTDITYSKDRDLILILQIINICGLILIEDRRITFMKIEENFLCSIDLGFSEDNFQNNSMFKKLVSNITDNLEGPYTNQCFKKIDKMNCSKILTVSSLFTLTFGVFLYFYV
jgi:hypothetical protein